MSDHSARFENMTPLQRAVYALKETQARLARIEQRESEPIAIIGMACRLPGGITTLDGYWNLLVNQQSAIEEVPSDRWDIDAFYDVDPTVPGKMNTRRGGFIHDVGLFDNQFFGISEREALMIDPQQRLLLELAWEALEDAGSQAKSLRGTATGVFIGIGIAEYIGKIIGDSTAGNPYASLGNALAGAANRISYAFDWHGPSYAIDTACSSSLVAMQQACSSIHAGECSAAIVGGVNLTLNPLTTVNLTKAGVCSPHGTIRSFDANADGYVRSEAAGVVMLKPLSAALANGDRIYATIAGGAVNHNGTGNGLSAPRRETQELLLEAACKSAKMSPDAVQYVEAHSTGTLIGDAIEAIALQNVMEKNRSAQDPLRIGSVKTNLGHTETASGVVSVIKVALSMLHAQLPATINHERLNPNIPNDKGSLRVVRATEPWQTTGGEYVAGVSAFGFGGSNAHLILRASDALRPARASQIPPELRLPLVFSAKSKAALKALASKYASYLNATDASWYDICANAALRREHHGIRAGIEASSKAEAATMLQSMHDFPQATGIVKTFIDQEELDWKAIFASPYNVVDLPKYAWQHKKFWLENAAIPENVLMDSQRSGSAARLCKTHAEQPIDNQLVDSSLTNGQDKAARAELSTEYVAPSTTLEEALANRWSRVLGIDRVGIHDNFFELGGDSMQAGSLLNLLQSELNEQIHFMALFESQTVAKLANYLKNNYSESAARLTVDCRSAASEPTLKESNVTTQPVATPPAQSNKIPRLQRKPTRSPATSQLANLTDRQIQDLLVLRRPTPSDVRDGNE